jgi:hypothetical protein
MAGGGVGEAMLIGAAVGGGSAAVTGGDPLKGALLGGLTGGVGAGVAPALQGLAGGAATLPTAAAGATTGAATGATTGAAAGTAAGAGSAGISALPIATEQAAANIMSQQPILQTTQNALASQNLLQSGLDVGGFNPALQASQSAPTSFQLAMRNPVGYIKANPFLMGSAGLAGATGARRPMEEEEEYTGPLSRFRFNPESYRPAFYADGGIASLPSGYDRMVGEMPMYQGMASGGISDLGSYSDGGRMLKGPGDGMSDSIPASIAGRRPARLATEEFVVPADVVSGLGNGSSDAGARQLYAMMDRVRKARTGTKKQGREINPRKYVPA